MLRACVSVYLDGLVGLAEGLDQVDDHTVVAGEDGHLVHLHFRCAQVDRAHEGPVPVRVFVVAAAYVPALVEEQTLLVLAAVVVDPHPCTHRLRSQVDVGVDDTDSDAFGRRHAKHEVQGVRRQALHPAQGGLSGVLIALAELVRHHGELPIVEQQLAGRLVIG